MSQPSDKSDRRAVRIEPWGEGEFEYPAGHFMQCNDGRFDLSADG